MQRSTKHAKDHGLRTVRTGPKMKTGLVHVSRRRPARGGLLLLLPGEGRHERVVFTPRRRHRLKPWIGHNMVTTWSQHDHNMITTWS